MDPKVREKRCSLIARMISWFDAYSVLSTTDPEIVEKALKDYAGSDLDAIWKEVKDDVYMIANFPSKSPDVERYSQILRRTRLGLFLGSLAAIFFMLLITLGRISFPFDPVYGLFIPFAVLYGVFGINTYLGRVLNRKVVQFYETHQEELAPRQKRIRKAVQKLIDKLYIDVKSLSLDSSKFNFQVFNTDYKNIRVVKGRGGRFYAVVEGTEVKKTKKS
ncbi:MAG: hypothetical protein QXR69_01095 [Conexivisphaerales archaeon]